MTNHTNWNIPVARVLDEALEEAVKRDAFSSKADFVRCAVRRQLENMGYHPQGFAKEATKDGQL